MQTGGCDQPGRQRGHPCRPPLVQASAGARIEGLRRRAPTPPKHAGKRAVLPACPPGPPKAGGSGSRARPAVTAAPPPAAHPAHPHPTPAAGYLPACSMHARKSEVGHAAWSIWLRSSPPAPQAVCPSAATMAGTGGKGAGEERNEGHAGHAGLLALLLALRIIS